MAEANCSTYARQQEANMTKSIAIIAAALVALGLIIGTAIVLTQSGGDDRFASCRKTVVSGPPIGGPFELVAGNGELVSDTDVIKGPTLIYFGYTFCPDVCPIDTVRNAEAADLLEADGVDVGLAMITIDPARDTAEVMQGYVENIHEDMVGLTGEQSVLDQVLKSYRVYAQKSGDDPEYYLMDHSSYTYLTAPGGNVLEVIRRTDTPEQVAQTVGCYAGLM